MVILLWPLHIMHKTNFYYCVFQSLNMMIINSKNNLSKNHCVKYGNFTWFPSETMRKLCLSTKFPRHEIGWNYGILRSDHISSIRVGIRNWICLLQFNFLSIVCRITCVLFRSNNWEWFLKKGAPWNQAKCQTLSRKIQTHYNS